MSRSKLPAKVSLRGSILHAATKLPIYVPGVGASVASGRIFTSEDSKWGFPKVIPGGGSSLLSGLGAYDPHEDALCVRIDFAVAEAPVEPESGGESDKEEGADGAEQEEGDDEKRIDDEKAGRNTKLLDTSSDLGGANKKP